MLVKLFRKLQPVLYPFIKWYFRKPRILIKRGIKIKLYPSVFHPSFYLSTEVFLDFILTLAIEEKMVLELGAGNGLIAMYLAANKNCQVTASDINPWAIKGLIESTKLNKLSLNIIESDLFDQISKQSFDYIFVNPPYYPKRVNTVDEFAFFCGEQFEYFHQFFQQVKCFLENNSICLMILSDTAAISSIITLAKKYQITMQIIFEQKRIGEKLSIFSLSAKQFTPIIF